jgi:hypothetical protein
MRLAGYSPNNSLLRPQQSVCRGYVVQSRGINAVRFCIRILSHISEAELVRRMPKVTGGEESCRVYRKVAVILFITATERAEGMYLAQSQCSPHCFGTRCHERSHAGRSCRASDTRMTWVPYYVPLSKLPSKYSWKCRMSVLLDGGPSKGSCLLFWVPECILTFIKTQGYPSKTLLNFLLHRFLGMMD